jgi:hypothetical protein
MLFLVHYQDAAAHNATQVGMIGANCYSRGIVTHRKSIAQACLSLKFAVRIDARNVIAISSLLERRSLSLSLSLSLSCSFYLYFPLPCGEGLSISHA